MLVGVISGGAFAWQVQVPRFQDPQLLEPCKRMLSRELVTVTPATLRASHSECNR